jgi:phenylacetate-CoA ligase
MNELRLHECAEYHTYDQMLKMQEMQLKKHLAYCIENSPYYHKLLSDKQINYEDEPHAILSKLPLTEKSDIEACNDDFLAVPHAEVVDIALSSGTTGQPIRMMYTKNDLDRLAFNEEQALRRCGITEEDIVLITCTIDRCFIAGLAYLYGVHKLGAAAIRNGRSSLESHMGLIKELKPTVIIGVPSFLKKLGLHFIENNIDPKETSVNKLVCIGESLRDNSLKSLGINEDLEKAWRAKTYSTYASSEIVTTFCECVAQRGGHITPELGIVEIVNDVGEVLPDGSVGEVVVTPLSVEGMPLVRYKTGDMSFLTNEACECGLFSPRLGPILGRKKQMLKMRGTTLYPQMVFSVLDGMSLVSEYYMIVESENKMSDKITVYASLNNETSNDVGKIQEALQAKIRVKPSVVIVDENTAQKQVYTKKSRKPVRFIDRRELYV